MNIELDALPGESLLHKLLHYFRLHADIGKGFHITRPDVLLPYQSQRGESCKLSALAHAIGYIASVAKIPCLPLYKDRTYPRSLREIAKKHGSKVGEMYSLESLVATCHSSGFAAEISTPYNEDDYILALQTFIDRNLAPLVFFDLDLTEGDRQGFPYIGDGRNEHAAVAVAYYKNEYDETRFIVSHWEQYYDFDGMELARSACYSLVDKREVETFCKVVTSDEETAWVLKDKVRASDKVLEGVPERTASPMRDTDTPLKGKILAVSGRFFSSAKATVVDGEQDTAPDSLSDSPRYSCEYK